MDQKQVDAWMASGKGRRLHCEDGLYLCRNKNGFSWALIWMKDGRRREMGMGAYSADPAKLFRLREARWATVGMDKERRDGVDLIAEKRRNIKVAKAKVTTFNDVAEMYVRDVGSRIWKDVDDMSGRFRGIVANYCKAIADMPVQDIAVADVKRAISPWVTTRPTAAANIASVIRRVIDTAIAHEFRGEGVNPADKRILSKVLAMKHETTHHASMPWEDAPAFYQGLGDTVPLKGLRLLMLTVLRRSELTGLQWSEIDHDKQLIVLPPERMKAKRPHVVPLSSQAIDLLRSLQSNGRYVFPSSKVRGQPISARRFGEVPLGGYTLHGFRATFRTWAEDHGADATLAEHALAHTVGDQTQKAYRRGTAVELRRDLMQRWADHLTAG